MEDLVKFQRMAKDNGEDPDSLTRLPLFLLKAVTKGYDFSDDQCLALYAKAGGLQGSLAATVSAMFGLSVDRTTEAGGGEPDTATPTG